MASAEYKQFLSSKFKSLENEMTEVRDSVKRLSEILIGSDGEHSLVRRVVENENKISRLEKIIAVVRKPDNIFSKLITVRDLILFGAFMSIWYVQEARNAMLQFLGDIINSLGFF